MPITWLSNLTIKLHVVTWWWLAPKTHSRVIFLSATWKEDSNLGGEEEDKFWCRSQNEDHWNCLKPDQFVEQVGSSPSVVSTGQPLHLVKAESQQRKKSSNGRTPFIVYRPFLDGLVEDSFHPKRIKLEWYYWRECWELSLLIRRKQGERKKGKRWTCERRQNDT